jgi:predicted molibdopterin-dependent oxidoreductase YjgC
MPEITINGRHITVAAKTSVAAAILQQGEFCFRRSVTGEPRAALCGMGICFECRVTIDGAPHVLSCQTLCADGMVVETA